MGADEGLGEKKPTMSTREVAQIVRQVLEEDQKTKEDQTNHQELVSEVKELKGMICDPLTGECRLPTKSDLEAIKESIPQVLDGEHDLNSFFNKVAAEKAGGRLHKILGDRIPGKLQAQLVAQFCKDGKCQPYLKGEEVRVHDDEHPQKGAFPGSVR